MGEILVKVMVEVLSILAIATKEINRSGTSTFIRGVEVYSFRLTVPRSTFEEASRKDRHRGRVAAAR